MNGSSVPYYSSQPRQSQPSGSGSGSVTRLVAVLVLAGLTGLAAYLLLTHKSSSSSQSPSPSPSAAMSPSAGAGLPTSTLAVGDQVALGVPFSQLPHLSPAAVCADYAVGDTKGTVLVFTGTVCTAPDSRNYVNVKWMTMTNPVPCGRCVKAGDVPSWTRKADDPTWNTSYLGDCASAAAIGTPSYVPVTSLTKML